MAFAGRDLNSLMEQAMKCQHRGINTSHVGRNHHLANCTCWKFVRLDNTMNGTRMHAVHSHWLPPQGTCAGVPIPARGGCQSLQSATTQYPASSQLAIPPFPGVQPQGIEDRIVIANSGSQTSSPALRMRQQACVQTSNTLTNGDKSGKTSNIVFFRNLRRFDEIDKCLVFNIEYTEDEGLVTQTHGSPFVGTKYILTTMKLSRGLVQDGIPVKFTRTTGESCRGEVTAKLVAARLQAPWCTEWRYVKCSGRSKH